MPNWCSNYIQFEGSPEQLKQIEGLFLLLKIKEEKTGHGQLPDFIQEKEGYFFDISWNEDVLAYETKWSPNLEIMKAVGQHYGVHYIHSYHEPGCLVYGEAEYKGEEFSDIFLEPSDFDLYEMNPEDEDTWLFEGKVYESDLEILEMLLERKKQNQLSNLN